jgi:hypothetical protein
VLEELQAQETLGRTEAIRIRETAVAEAREHLADATGQADRIRTEAKAGVAEAHRELDELRALQHQVSEQLTSVRALLDWTLPRIAASGQPAPTAATPDLRLVESKPEPAPTPLGAQPRPLAPAADAADTGWGSDWLNRPARVEPDARVPFANLDTGSPAADVPQDDAVATAPDPSPRRPMPTPASASPGTAAFPAVSNGVPNGVPAAASTAPADEAPAPGPSPRPRPTAAGRPTPTARTGPVPATGTAAPS